jgi:hypothetical protein
MTPVTINAENGRLPTPRFIWYVSLKTKGNASNYTIMSLDIARKQEWD